MPGRLTISLKRDEALRATRVSVGKNKLVYILIADKRIKYANGSSRIVYIGTTKKGLARVARSVAVRAEEIFQRLRGVREFHARLVVCRPRAGVQTWTKLERALLLSFRERFGEIPKCNSQGRKMRERDEFDYFTRKRIAGIIHELS